MAGNTFKLNVLTPEKLVYNGNAQSAVAHGTNGYLGILPNHAPLLTSLEIGELRIIDNEGQTQIFTLSGGFMEVITNEVTILAETAEYVDIIDIQRAKVAKDQAEQQIAKLKQEKTDLHWEQRQTKERQRKGERKSK